MICRENGRSASHAPARTATEPPSGACACAPALTLVPCPHPPPPPNLAPWRSFFLRTMEPLGPAEWVKYVAAFFNLEADANRIFENITVSCWLSDGAAHACSLSAFRMADLRVEVTGRPPHADGR